MHLKKRERLKERHNSCCQFRVELQNLSGQEQPRPPLLSKDSELLLDLESIRHKEDIVPKARKSKSQRINHE
jgi:hypothetical protein